MEHKQEKRICQSCKKDFVIEPEDFNFYEKIKVSPPTLCPECRFQRRYSWRNEVTLYRRPCELCGKSAVTIYSPKKPYKVYCPNCWWGDGWDAKNIAQDFDFSRPFFEQFYELQLKVPRIALLTKNSVNSEYTNHSGDNKNCYMCVSTFYSENVMYSTNVWDKGQDLCDCALVMKNGVLSYECIDSSDIYRCQFSILLKDCTDCFYCYDLHNCQNCFLSYNLRNQNYMILNKKYSKEEYDKKIKEFYLSSYKARKGLFAKFMDLIKEKALHKFAVMENTVNSTGNMLFNSRNAKKVFDTNRAEDSKYGIIVPEVKNSMDISHVGFSSELLYESHALVRSYNVFFTHLSYDNNDIQYCDSCHNSNNLFGCCGIKKGSYMIFNKKYSKEEYLELREKIIEHMKKTGEYGEFFPTKFSPFKYNESHAQTYIPLSKKEAVEKGFGWEDNLPGTYGKETITPENLPDSIENVSDSITKEILKCENCGKNYNIVPNEFTFYKRENIPIPHFCYACRYKRRISLRLPRKLWHGQCMCERENHGHKDKCQNEFETAYAPGRPETVYCEKCYQQEVY